MHAAGKRLGLRPAKERTGEVVVVANSRARTKREDRWGRDRFSLWAQWQKRLLCATGREVESRTQSDTDEKSELLSWEGTKQTMLSYTHTDCWCGDTLSVWLQLESHGCSAISTIVPIKSSLFSFPSVSTSYTPLCSLSSLSSPLFCLHFCFFLFHIRLVPRCSVSLHRLCYFFYVSAQAHNPVRIINMQACAPTFFPTH